MLTACSPVKDQDAARVMLCIQVNSFFKEGWVERGMASYLCHRGEWITSAQELSARMGMDYRTIQKMLKEFVSLGWLTVKKMGNYICLGWLLPMAPERHVAGGSFTLMGDNDAFSTCNIYSGGRI